MKNSKFWSARNIALMGMLGAMAALLMYLEIPLVFLAPNFYKMDFSEIPVMVGTFALGPFAGGLIEVIKILIKLLIKPTSTGGVGELANFVVGCAMAVPAGLLYRARKNKKTAVKALLLGTLCMTVLGVVVNALVMLPFYSKFMPMETIISLGAKIVPAVNSVWTFCLFCVGPFNLFKGLVISLITFLLYKRVSPLIHSFRDGERKTKA